MRKKQKPSVYEGKWTPIFEDVPAGMILADRAVYGYIRRMEHLDAKKCIASAKTIGESIGADEKTVDRSLSRLEKWNVIECVQRGKTKREPSHFVTKSRKDWAENEIQHSAEEKTQNRRTTRVNLSKTRVNLSDDKGQFVQDKGQIDPQRDYKRVYKESIRDSIQDIDNQKEENVLIEKAESLESLHPDKNPTPSSAHPLPAMTPRVAALLDDWKKKKNGSQTLAGATA